MNKTKPSYKSQKMFGQNVYPVALPDRTRVMRCENEFIKAGSVWVKVGGGWVCSESSPEISWMIGMNHSQAKLELIRMGMTWEWI